MLVLRAAAGGAQHIVGQDVVVRDQRIGDVTAVSQDVKEPCLRHRAQSQFWRKAEEGLLPDQITWPLAPQQRPQAVRGNLLEQQRPGQLLAAAEEGAAACQLARQPVLQRACLEVPPGGGGAGVDGGGDRQHQVADVGAGRGRVADRLRNEGRA